MNIHTHEGMDRGMIHQQIIHTGMSQF